MVTSTVSDEPDGCCRRRHKVPMAPAGWKPSKYRVIEPTLAEDLVKHYPGMLVTECSLSHAVHTSWP